MNHCLHCGFNRRELKADQRCPECGNESDLEAQAARCRDLARRPARLLRQVLLLRPFPRGWWEVLDGPSTWWRGRAWTPLTVGVVFLLLLALGAGGTSVRSVLVVKQTFYGAGDTGITSPRADRQRTYAVAAFPMASFEFMTANGAVNIAPDWQVREDRQRFFHVGQPSFVGLTLRMRRTVVGIALFTVGAWLAMRFIGLPMLWRRGFELEEDDRAALRRAANAATMILPAHFIWLTVACGLGFAVAVPLVGLVGWNLTGAVTHILFMLALFLYPALAWWAMIAGDASRRVYPDRTITLAVLVVTHAGAGVLTLMIIAAAAWAGF